MISGASIWLERVLSDRVHCSLEDRVGYVATSSSRMSSGQYIKVALSRSLIRKISHLSTRTFFKVLNIAQRIWFVLSPFIVPNRKFFCRLLVNGEEREVTREKHSNPKRCETIFSCVKHSH